MKTFMRKSGAILTTAVCLTTAASSVHAQNTADGPEIVVTGTRVARTVDESLSPVTVVTRAEIENKQPLDIQNLVRDVPGISLVNSGGLGKATSISLRGSETNHVLILVDGVRIGSATTGSVQLQHIPIQQLPQSSDTT